MKKILSLIILAIIFLTPKSFAAEAYFDTDVQSQFTTATASGNSAYLVTNTNWTFESGQDSFDSNIYFKSPKVYVDGNKIQNVEIPNYVVFQDGTTEANAWDSVKIYLYTTVESTYASDIISLNDFGPGALSSWKLNTAKDVSSGPKYMQIVTTLSTYGKGSQIVNGTHFKMNQIFSGMNTMDKYLFPNTYAARLRMYSGSLRMSFNHSWINSLEYLKTKNYFSTVTIRTTTEFIPPTDPEGFDTVSDLPVTVGSIFSDKLAMGRAYFSLNNRTLTTKVEYQGDEWYLQHTLSNDMDLSIFNSTYEVFYYTFEGNKYFLINHGQQSMFLSNNTKSTAFIPYTVWNLTTNEFKTVKRLNTYLYSKVENNKNIYVYFYADNLVIDNLMVATVAMEYRYRYNVELWGAEPYQPYLQVLEKGQMAFAGVPWFQRFVTLGIAGVVYPELFTESSLPTLLAGTIGNVFFGEAGLTFDFKTINQIEKITPTSEFANELSQAYQEVGMQGNVNQALSVFKLHLGYFDKSFSKGVEINPEFNKIGNQKGINLIELTYETNGQVHTISGEDIDVSLNRGDGTDTDADLDLTELNINISGIIGILSGVVIGVIIIVSSATNGAFISKRKGFNFGAFFGTFIGAALAGLILGGLIYFIVELIFTGGFISI